jgi:hypothetical protein
MNSPSSVSSFHGLCPTACCNTELAPQPYKQLIGPWTGNWPISRLLPAESNAEKKRRHASMPRAGFETKIPVVKRRKLEGASACVATMNKPTH